MTSQNNVTVNDLFANIANVAANEAILQAAQIDSGGFPVASLASHFINMGDLSPGGHVSIQVHTPDDRTSYYLLGGDQIGAGQMVGWTNAATSDFDSVRGWYAGNFQQHALATDTESPHKVWAMGSGGMNSILCGDGGGDSCTMDDIAPSGASAQFTLKYPAGTDIQCASSDYYQCTSTAGLDSVTASGWSDEFKADMRDAAKAMAETADSLCGYTFSTQPTTDGVFAGTTATPDTACIFFTTTVGEIGYPGSDVRGVQIVTDYKNWQYGLPTDSISGSPDIVINNGLPRAPNDTRLHTFVDDLNDCLKRAFDSYLTGEPFNGCDTSDGAPASCGPVVPGIHWGDLSQGADFSKFPFGVFGYAQDTLTPLVADPQAPSFDVPVSLPSVGSGAVHVDLSPANSYMAKIRLFATIGMALAAIYMFASSVLGLRVGNPSGGLDDDGSVDEL